jgi:hypothetical protein
MTETIPEEGNGENIGRKANKNNHVNIKRPLTSV